MSVVKVPTSSKNEFMKFRKFLKVDFFLNYVKMKPLVIPWALLILCGSFISSEAAKCGDAYTAEELSAALTAALEKHNLYRCMHNAPALKLDDELTKVAQAYSQQLVSIGNLKHSGADGLGENLYSSMSSSTDRPEAKATMIKAIDSWYSEVKEYSSYEESKGKMTGHFTQVVWKGTTAVGMGIATVAKGGCQVYVTGNYKPPGNYVGEKSHKENVEPKPSKSEGDCAAGSAVKKPETAMKTESTSTPSKSSPIPGKTDSNTAPTLGKTDTSMASSKPACLNYNLILISILISVASIHYL